MGSFSVLYDSKIEPIVNACNNVLSHINDDALAYKTLLKFHDIFAVSALKNGYNEGYNLVLRKLKTYNKSFEFTKSAIIKRRQKIDILYFKRVNDTILDIICKNEDVCNDEYRLLAVDGTRIYVEESLTLDGSKLSNNKNCCIGLISVIFDCEKKIPINYEFSTYDNERAALLKQFTYFKENDILIHDRGYYSNEMLYQYHTHKINAIFRMPSKHKFVKKFKKRNDSASIVEVKINKRTIPLRLIKYELNIDGKIEKYYIGTTIIDKKYDIEFFKKTYWKRWNIETHIRHCKYDLSFANIKSKSLNVIKQDLYSNHFVFLLSSYIEYLLTPHIKDNLQGKYKINTKNCLDSTIDTILKEIFYGKENKKEEICYQFKLLLQSDSLVGIQKDRHNVHRRKKPVGKWNLSGTTSNRPKVKPIKHKDKNKTNICEDNKTIKVKKRYIN